MFFHHKEQPRTHFYGTVAMTFVVLSLCVVAVVFYISFSWATIVLTPQDQVSDKTVTVRIAESTNDEQGVVQGVIMTDELEAQGTYTPQSSSSVVQKASGVITVINTTAKSQPLRETTRLLSDGGVLFRTTENVVVGARQSLEVPVVADKEGDVGEVGGSKFVLPGLWPGLQDKIYGQGFESREKGSKLIYTVSQNDIDKAKDDLLKKLNEKFLSITQNTALNGSFHPKELRSVVTSVITSTTADQALGAQVDAFTLRMRAKFTGVFFDGIDVKNYAEQVFRKELQTGYDLEGLDIQKFEYNLEDIDRAGKKALVSLHTPVGRIKSADYLALEKRSLVGKTANQVVSYFESTPDITNVRVKFYPFWVTRTPLLHDHINIIIEKSTQ